MLHKLKAVRKSDETHVEFDKLVSLLEKAEVRMGDVFVTSFGPWEFIVEILYGKAVRLYQVGLKDKRLHCCFEAVLPKLEEATRRGGYDFRLILFFAEGRAEAVRLGYRTTDGSKIVFKKVENAN